MGIWYPADCSISLASGGGGGGGTPTLILDTVTGASAAYATRRIKGAYLGSAIQVRNAGGTLQNIGFAGNDLDVSTLKTFLTGGTGTVATWYDQTGNGNHLTAATPNQPSIVFRGGKAYINFNGTSNYMSNTLATAITGTALTGIVAAAQNGQNANPYSRAISLYKTGDANDFSTATSCSLLEINTDDDSTLYHVYSERNNATLSTIKGSKDNIGVFSSKYDGTNHTMYFNGLAGTAVASTGSFNIQNIRLGAQIGLSATEYWNGIINEFALYPSAVGNTNRALYEADLTTYYSCPPALQTADDGIFFVKMADTVTYNNIRATDPVTHVADPGSTGIYSGNFPVTDLNYQVTTSNSDPLLKLNQPGFPSRASGTTTIIANPPGTHVPASLVIPDASGGDTPNNPCIIYNRTTGESLYLNIACRLSGSTTIFGYVASKQATHGGSGIAGGAITLAELTGGLIPHALAVNVWGEKYLSNTGGGFVYPAVSADSGFNSSGDPNFYGGSQAAFKMGSKVGIVKTATVGSLGLSASTASAAILKAFQDWGGYIVDNTAWDAWAINCISDADSAMQGIVSDLKKIMAALQYIT